MKSGQYDMWGEWKEYASFEVEPDKYVDVYSLHDTGCSCIDCYDIPTVAAPEPPVQPQEKVVACIDCSRPLIVAPNGCHCWEKDL